MIGACLSRMLQDRADWWSAQGFAASEIVMGLLAMGLATALLMAPWMTALYRRRMTRLMSLRLVGAPAPAAPDRSTRPDEPAPVADPMSPDALDEAMRRRLRRTRQATGLAYLAFVAGTGLALPLHAFQSTADSLSKVVAAAALAAGPAFINATSRLSPKWYMAGAGALMVLAGLLEHADSPEDRSDILFGLVFVVAFAIVAVHRTWRAMFVPLAVLATAAWVGVTLAVAAVQPGLCGAAAVPVSEREIDATGMVIVTTIATLVIWAGTRLVARLAHGYERGLFSDISLVAAFGLAAVAALLCFSADAPGVSAWRVALTWAAWIGLTVAAYALGLRRTTVPQGARSLLVLRVFSHDRRSEPLLDAVQTRWRYAGPVLQIGGPDLAALNIDPHEFARYLSGHEHELFLADAASAGPCGARLDATADREGRYRINEVFCLDSTWQATVERLIGTADAILLDVRDFKAGRTGTAFELDLLHRMRRMDRVVMVGDDRTDWAQVDAIVGTGSGETRLDARRERPVDACLEALRRAATADVDAPAPGRRGAGIEAGRAAAGG